MPWLRAYRQRTPYYEKVYPLTSFNDFSLNGAIVRALAPLIALFYIAAISERAWLFYRSR